MNPPSLELSNTLDLDTATREFQARGRTRLGGVLHTSCADALHDCLRRDVPWKLAYNRGRQAVVVDVQQLRSLDAAGTQDLSRAILEGARTGFQYAYYSYPMVTAYLRQENPGLLLHRLLEWLSTPTVLDVVRTISGIAGLIKCDAQATCYLPGHFLNCHDDRGAGSEGRRVGYVLNLTRRWRPEWGGQLQFLAGTNGEEVEESWVPVFNSLVLFRVPVLHAVSYVPPFAGEPRLAITGWFRDA